MVESDFSLCRFPSSVYGTFPVKYQQTIWQILTNLVCTCFFQPTVDVQNAPPKTASDPYQDFLAGQKKREKEWKANRDAKKAKIDSASFPCQADPNTSQDVTTEVYKQLEAKTEECSRLKAKKAKIDSASFPCRADPNTSQDVTTEVYKQLEAKTEECSRLKAQLQSTEEALRKQMNFQENVFKVRYL